MTVTDWTRSDNSAPVGASTTRFYLVTGTTIDVERDPDREPGHSRAGRLDDEHRHDHADAAGHGDGDYRIIAKADADDAVVEANENNNVSAPSAAFTLGSDLRALSGPSWRIQPGGRGVNHVDH